MTRRQTRRRDRLAAAALGAGAALGLAAAMAWGPAAGSAATLACEVVNGGMEDVAPSQQPADWTSSPEIRASPRAHTGDRAAAFMGRHASLRQVIGVDRSPADVAILTFWVLRDSLLDEFVLTVTLADEPVAVSVSEDSVPADSWTLFRTVVPSSALEGEEAELAFGYNRRSLKGVLDLDDVELDLCLPRSPTPYPTDSGPTPVPDTQTCAVRNGSFETLDGVRPRYWSSSGNVEITTRAVALGERAVRFTQGNARLTQVLSGVDPRGRPRRLGYWIYREEGAGGFSLVGWLGSTAVFTHTAASLPFGPQVIFEELALPSLPPGSDLRFDLTWAMSGSGAVYLDAVALDLCAAAVPSPTVRPPGSSVPTATPPRGTGTPGTPGTPGPTGTVTAAGTLTATEVVSATYTPEPSPTSTPTATDTPTATPTPSATATATRARPAAAYLPHVSRASDLAAPKPRVWGLQFALEEDPAQHRDNVAVELGRAQGAGMSSVRTAIRWDTVEPANTSPDRFDWSGPDRRLGDYAAAGFDTFVSLVGYPAWATRYQCGYALHPGMEAEWRSFAREAARRYGQAPFRVAAWEIGNEPDGKTEVTAEDMGRDPAWGGGQPSTPYGGCWGDRAPEYKEFLRMAYEEIKSVDPTAVVTMGGLAYVDVGGFHPEFFDRLLEAGGGPYVDVINFHWFPNIPNEPRGPEKMRRILASSARHGFRRQVWISETYRLTYPTAPDIGNTDQVEYLTKEIVEVLAFPELERVYWYGWVDFPPEMKSAAGATDRGMVSYDHIPKPAFRVLPYTIAYTNGDVEDLSTAGVRAFRFRRLRSGEDYVIAWSRDGRPARLDVAAGARGLARVTTFPARAVLAGECCPSTFVVDRAGTYALDVGRDSVFVELGTR